MLMQLLELAKNPPQFTRRCKGKWTRRQSLLALISTRPRNKNLIDLIAEC